MQPQNDDVWSGGTRPPKFFSHRDGIIGDMFHWCDRRRDAFVVLNKDEEWALLAEVENNVIKRCQYTFVGADHNKLFKKMCAHLRDQSRQSPVDFRRKYVFRSAFDNGAQEVLKLMFHGYWNFFGRADFNFDTRGDTKVFEIRLFEPRVLSRLHEAVERYLPLPQFTHGLANVSLPKYVGSLSLPRDSVKRLVGTVADFSVLTTSSWLRFHRNFVRIEQGSDFHERFILHIDGELEDDL